MAPVKPVVFVVFNVKLPSAVEVNVPPTQVTEMMLFPVTTGKPAEVLASANALGEKRIPENNETNSVDMTSVAVRDRCFLGNMRNANFCYLPSTNEFRCKKNDKN